MTTELDAKIAAAYDVLFQLNLNTPGVLSFDDDGEYRRAAKKMLREFYTTGTAYEYQPPDLKSIDPPREYKTLDELVEAFMGFDIFDPEYRFFMKVCLVDPITADSALDTLMRHAKHRR